MLASRASALLPLGRREQRRHQVARIGGDRRGLRRVHRRERGGHVRPLGGGNAREELGGGAVAPIQREHLARLLRRFFVATRFERCARLAVETRDLRGDLARSSR